MGIQHMWAIMTAKELMEMVARGNCSAQQRVLLILQKTRSCLE